MKRTDPIKLHFLVLIWGFAAILGELISLPSQEITFFRTLLAAVALFLLLKLRGFSLKVDRREFLKITGIGALMGIHWILFFMSVKVSTVAVCLTGMATTSLWTSFIEPILFKRKLAFHEVLLGIVVIIGILIIFRYETGYGYGLMLAIMSAFLAALFTVFNGRIIKRYHHHLLTFYQMSSASVVVLLIMLFYYFSEGRSIEFTPTSLDWLWLLLLSLGCTVYAWAEFFELMKRMTPFAVNLVLNLEPVYGILFALAIFGEKEQMNFEFYIGAGILLLSILIYPLMKKRFSLR